MERGSTLVMAMFLSLVLCTLVASMLGLLQTENRQVYRSGNFSQAFQFAEAGAEEGVAMLTYGASSWDANGWSASGTNYTKSVNNVTAVGSGASVGSYQVTIFNPSSSNPQIVSTGTVSNAYLGSTLSRTVKLIMKNKSQFPAGILAKGNIDLEGEGTIDSFDSSDSTKSTGGQYDAAKKQVNGNVATIGGAGSSVTVGMDVYGDIATAPSATVTMDGGSMGATTVSAQRSTTTADAQSKGWLTSDASYDIPDVTLPSGLNSAFFSGSVTNSTTLNGGDYKINKINLTGSSVLTIQSTVRLYVTNTINISDTAKIVVAAGATLEVYVAKNVTISGQGVVNNSGNASKVLFYGLPTSTSWDLTSNDGTWIGAIYAPQASLSYTLNGENGYHHGAIVTSSFSLNGNINIHYDEALRNTGNAGYSVAAWQEL